MKQYQSPFKFRRQKSVLFVCDETDGETQREREKKRNQAFTIKSQALLYSSFPRCSKSKEHNFGSHNDCISLFVSKNVCGVCWCSQKKKKRERKGRSFFLKTSKTLNVNSHQKKFTLFSLLFSSQFSFWAGDFLRGSLSLSLSLSLRRKRRKRRRARFLVVVVVLHALFLFFIVVVVKGVRSYR